MRNAKFGLIGLPIMLLALAMPAQSQAAVDAVCVPWKSGLDLPHPTYSGQSHTVKGIARGGATQYRWDFGDGSVVTTSQPTVTHAYPSGNNDYVVTLTVRDKFLVPSAEASATCRIRGGGKKPPNQHL